MNTAAWNLWLARLAPERREEVGVVLDRITTVVDEMRNLTLDDIQRVERRQASLSEKQAEIVARLDRYEDQQARYVRAEIDRMLGETISRQEFDGMMTAIFELTARIQKLEPLADFAVRVHAAEQRCVELQAQVVELLAREVGGDASSRT